MQVGVYEVWFFFQGRTQAQDQQHQVSPQLAFLWAGLSVFIARYRRDPMRTHSADITSKRVGA